jgi:16S rRNA (guanine527-N7)-methyltransferase
VEIHAMRIEDLAKSTERLEPDVVSARALAPLPRLFELAAPFFGPNTRGLFLKGEEADIEVEAARRDWDFSARLHQSLTSARSRIVEVTDLEPRGDRAS